MFYIVARAVSDCLVAVRRIIYQSQSQSQSQSCCGIAHGARRHTRWVDASYSHTRVHLFFVEARGVGEVPDFSSPLRGAQQDEERVGGRRARIGSAKSRVPFDEKNDDRCVVVPLSMCRCRVSLPLELIVSHWIDLCTLTTAGTNFFGGCASRPYTGTRATRE